MSACPAYQPTHEVSTFLREQGVSATHLHEMIAHAAPYTHELGNRRFHDWIFRVHGMIVDAITNLKTGASSAIKDAFLVYEDCPVCHGDDGHGHCEECGDTGEVPRYRRHSKKATIGVMQ